MMAGQVSRIGKPGLVLSFIFAASALAQTTGTAQAPSGPNQPETATKDEPVTFKTRVNLVMVPVVVRDRQGHAVGDLRQQDFQLFDKGKVQVITRFTVERPGGKAKTAEPGQPAAAGQPPQPSVPAGMPERFVAYLFDDIHINFGDLARVRDAAGRHMDSLLATDRAAIFTTSGQTQLEFTDDREALHRTLLALRPRPITGSPVQECPDISYYMADLIQNRQDPIATQAATAETMACMGMDSTQASSAKGIATGMAARKLSEGSHETRVTLSVLREILRRMAAAPGQRTLILVSPGFITPEEQQEKTELLDLAIRSNVIISALDARGLWTDTPDISRQVFDTFALRIKSQYDHDAAMAQADVMAEMAHGTGGTFFQNSNDLEEGFRRVATAPEFVYLLGFSPQNLKLDGGFHALKVTLKNGAGLSAQARRGYYAPKHLNDAAENARREIEEAVFSREEMHELPVDLHTQFFKPTDNTAKVTVLMHVDIKHLRFRKAEDRNNNELTVTSALFDRNGNYVIGNQKILTMRLLDQTLERRAEAGLTLRSTFDVQPGTYMIRMVVRDAEGQLMSADNGAIEIP